MREQYSNFSKVTEEYLKFIKSQEISGEPFRNKLEQLKNFYIPLSKMIYRTAIVHFAINNINFRSIY